MKAVLTGIKLGLVVLAMGCTQAQVKTANDAKTVVFKIAAGVCTEEGQDPNEPGYMKVACKVDQALQFVDNVAHVFIPLPEWAAMKAAADRAGAPPPALEN